MRKNNGFIERSIMGALSFLKESAFSDEIALRKGFLQAIDPRIKIAAFLVFMILILFTKNIFILTGIYIISIMLARFSKISLGFFLKRTLLFIPLFSLFIAIPALFSFATPGEILIVFKIAGLSMAVTRQGLSGAE
jgi:cobalt/nickel transport system permease protein